MLQASLLDIHKLDPNFFKEVLITYFPYKYMRSNSIPAFESVYCIVNSTSSVLHFPQRIHLLPTTEIKRCV